MSELAFVPRQLRDLADVTGDFADGDAPVFDASAGGGQGGFVPGVAGGVAQSELDAEAAARAAADALLIPLSEKGAASGVASLDGGGKVPDGQIPAGVARDSEVTAAVAAHAASTTGVHGIADTSALVTDSDTAATPAAGKIPVADSGGTLDDWTSMPRKAASFLVMGA